MKAIKFKECNSTYAKEQPEYSPLPAHKSLDGMVTTCWSFSFMERIKILIFGKLFLQILTFNKPLQPLKMEIDKPIMEK